MEREVVQKLFLGRIESCKKLHLKVKAYVEREEKCPQN